MEEKILLNQLSEGLPGITPAIANAMIEACIISLDSQENKNNCILKVDGETDKKYILSWDNDITEQMKRSWNDQEYTTDQGACCLAILLTLKITEYTIILRSAKKTGIDYWLGYKNDLLNYKARLEISGIRKKSKTNNIETRLKTKENQVKKSDVTNLPAYIAILEFSEPEARYIKKC